MPRLSGVLVVAALAAGTAMAAQKGKIATAPGPCERACLLSLADNYLAAMVAHDPTKVPLASDIKLVENVKRGSTSDGLWKNASSGPTEYKIVAADSWSQQVGGIVVLGSEGKPVQFGFRLKVVDGRIAEAEHLVVAIRDPNTPNLQKARPGIPLEVPYEYADSRGRMVHIAKSYYDALDNNKGNLAPIAAD